MAARTGFERTTPRMKGHESTNEPPRPQLDRIVYNFYLLILLWLVRKINFSVRVSYY